MTALAAVLVVVGAVLLVVGITGGKGLSIIIKWFGIKFDLELKPVIRWLFSGIGLIALLIGIGISGLEFFKGFDDPKSSSTIIIAPASLAPATITPSNDCKTINLINCGTIIPIFLDKESTSTYSTDSEGVKIVFENTTGTSGFALQLTPAQDFRGFSYLAISAKATKSFNFEIQYKQKAGDQLNIVATSPARLFTANTEFATVQIPIVYNGMIDEVAINFIKVNESAELIIKEMKLIKGQ